VPATTQVTPAATGIDGFLGTRASLGMDVVLVGLLTVLPLLAWSVALVRRGHYRLHRTLQVTIAGLLLAAIVLFEIDIRLVSDWKPRAAPSPHWPRGVLTALGIHLVFAVSTLGLWVWVMTEALRRFPTPAAPGDHGPRHRRWARWAAADLVLTAITGSCFYWLAFVSR
jgi:putative membrane protein